MEANQLRDSRGRMLRDLRVSVTDRCNLRCVYCLPETERKIWRSTENVCSGAALLLRPELTRAELLSFEEIERITRLAVNLGIRKIRLSGGEPLLRKQIEDLVERLAGIKGLADLAMTSNGLAFAKKAHALRKAGLGRITFSLDSLDRANFQKITGRDGLEEVLKSIAVAQQLGFTPIKINTVVIRGINEHEIEALAEYGRSHNLTVRFIEYMPLDSARGWRPELVVPGSEIMRRLQARYPLQPLTSDVPSETAKRWKFIDGPGEVGLITPVSEPFCGNCSRLRLTADGKLRTCLFSAAEYDLRTPLRQGASDAELTQLLQQIAWEKEPCHQIGHSDFILPTRTMSQTGG